MKKYRVTVNGTVYEVELEAIGGTAPTRTSMPVRTAPPAPARSAAPARAAAPAPARAAAPAPAPATAPAAAAPANGEKVCAPMPGNILAVNVAAGDTVKRGQVLMIMEAMKMENEIMAPCDGTIASVHTSKGSAVDPGALLCVIQ